ncbi:Prohibitin, partial [Plecturocebus cupreus]
MSKFHLALATAESIMNSASYNVDAGYRAIIFDRFHGAHTLSSLVAKIYTMYVILHNFFQPVSSQLPPLLTSIREVIPSIITEILKSVVACSDAGEQITQRAGLHTEAVEAKHVAQQEAERAKSVVQKAEQQEQEAIISAEGSLLIANSLVTVGDSLIELCQLEVTENTEYPLLHSHNIIYLLP